MIEVKYFGAVADKTQCEFENVAVSEISLQDLLQDLETRYQFNSLTFRVAVNQKIVSKETAFSLKSNDIVALLPPFAGG